MSEVGNVYAVEEERAGATVLGDTPADATTLNLLYGWDFSEGGGQARVTPGPSLSQGIFRKWSGDGRGGADDKFDTQSATVTEVASGDRSPQLQVSTSDNNGFVNWGNLGVDVEHAASIAVTLPEYPSSNVQVIVPLDSEGSKSWQLNIQSSGVLRLVSPSNTNLATGSQALPLNERIRLEVRTDGTTITATATDASGVVVDTLTATSTLGNMNNFRVGSVNKSTYTFFIDDVALSSADEAIGDWWADAPQPTPPRVGVIGDSLTAQDGQGKTRIVGKLVDAGYAPSSISFYAVGGKEIALPDVYGRTTVEDIQDARDDLGDIERWIIALGTNNVYMTDPQVEAAMDTVLAALGDDEFVWIGLAFQGAGNVDAARLNPVIQAKVEATPNGRFADWNSFVHNGRDESDLWGTEDSTHMSPAGYELRNEFMVSSLGEGPNVPVPEEDVVFTYLSAEYPDPEEEDDDLPTVLTLEAPIGVDLLDGDFVAVEPERKESYAWVTLKEEGEALRARIRQDLQDVLTEQIVDAAIEPKTVVLEQDEYGEWVVVEVLTEPLQRDPSVLDPNITVPPAIIPEEGVTQFSQAIIEQLIFERLQGRIAVIDEIYAARYDEDGNVAPDSNKIVMSSDLGFQMEVPNGEVVDGEMQYDVTIRMPTQAYDENGNRIVAMFRGKIIADDISVLQGISIQGSADEGFLSHITNEAILQLDNQVTDPATTAQVTFDAKMVSWPGVGNDREVGWSFTGTHVAQARVTGSGNQKLVTVRFINPASRTIAKSTPLRLASSNTQFPFRNVAGVAVRGDWIYALFRAEGPTWYIARFDANTGNWDKTIKSPAQQPTSRMALSADNEGLVLSVVANNDRLYLCRVGGGLGSTDWNATDVFNRLTPRGYAKGADGYMYVAVGSRIVCLNASYNEVASRSFWSRVGVPTAFGTLNANDDFAASSGDGRIAKYNSDAAVDGATLVASWTRLASGGVESLMSPAVESVWPARTFATIATDPPVPGAPFVRIYAGQSDARTSQFWTGNGQGQASVTLESVPASGDNPPSVSGFGDASTPGVIQSQAKAPNGDPMLHMNGSGELTALRTFQAGIETVSVPAADTTYEHQVLFRVPFQEPPVVMLTPQNVGSPQTVFVSAGKPTDPVATDGFTIIYRRSAGGDMQVGWQAMKQTQ